ncbi:MAG: hypothetical protein ISR69_15445 [Gammaproteobacteria bacterium]|nr:hypothetical protein [Gammaproteobacteria bacterium]
MTISEERIVELAQQYLSKLQKDNEIEFATFKPGVGEDYYVFLDVLEEECSHLADCLTIGYQNKEVEADLESALNVANIKVDRESKEYKLLIHTFLVAAEEACCEKLSMYKGKFDFKSKSTKLGTEEQPVLSTRKKRKSTTELQNYVNIIAREVMEKYPNNQKQYLAEDVSDILESKHGFKKKPSTILRDYLGKFPNF